MPYGELLVTLSWYTGAPLVRGRAAIVVAERSRTANREVTLWIVDPAPSAHFEAMTGCEHLTAGGAGTVGWLAVAGAAGLALGRRTAVDVISSNNMRPANWVAVALTTVGSIGLFLYMLSDVHNHCGSPSVEILFAPEPAAITGLLTVIVLTLVHRSRFRRRDGGRPDA